MRESNPTVVAGQFNISSLLYLSLHIAIAVYAWKSNTCCLVAVVVGMIAGLLTAINLHANIHKGMLAGVIAIFASWIIANAIGI